ncbi:hypothetical protein PCASD_02678 [Puccinia coronata f. sp. avenae]|uniref:Uncharacterized protein n=1 Tax=Puccinia coronata f. sp. avenae TaxID=200324 RepID=A0A2N5VH12_9BASI|nr:hypothetical protein PCASD_02678 [Puccinia coronata f. sp. avenae]
MSTGIEELGPLGFCDCEVKGGDSGGAEDANADEVDESSDNRAGAGARRPDPGQTWASVGRANNERFSVRTRRKPGTGLRGPRAARAHLQPEPSRAGNH